MPLTRLRGGADRGGARKMHSESVSELFGKRKLTMLFLQATLVEECPKRMLLCIRAGTTDEYIMKSRTLSRFRGVEWHLFLLNKLVLRYSDWLHCSH